MQLMTSLVRVLLVLFLIYTVTYIVQWIVGMQASLKRLSDFQRRSALTRSVLPDELSRSIPVTAIIPAHNEENCICATIHAMLDEDYPELHIVVVDDGSDDATAECVIREFHLLPELPAPRQSLSTKPVRRCYRRTVSGHDITLICKDNGGKSDALNCGVNFCRSDYCLVVDADTQIERGSTRLLLSAFLLDPDTVVCAGAVRDAIYHTPAFRQLSFTRKWLVRFQVLEYYRTFYMQRILFDRLNANIIVSGAFAMFRTDLIRAVGGYRTGIIGEDMELTMRLHAFCHAQKRPYRITVMPEARCRTQVPFRFRDFYKQRRRWHIGMIQSLRRHLYMVGSRYYGWAGIMSGTFVLIYELLSPFIEVMGLVTLAMAAYVGIVHSWIVVTMMLLYALMIFLTQVLFLHFLRTYHVEPISHKSQLRLVVVSLVEFLIFHPLNMVIKLTAFFTSRKNSVNWGRIQRSKSA